MENINKIKKKFIGKVLKSIIYLKVDNELKNWINEKISNEYYDIEMAQLLVFEDCFILFVDLDCDGYRSGDWHIKDFKRFAKKFLDKGYTEEIKNINSEVKDIIYYENGCKIGGHNSDSEFLLIETLNYVIEMGQEDFNDYYPSNFFQVKDIKDLIIEKR